MGLVLYYASGSPFAWRVHLACEHKQIPYEGRLLSFQKGETRSAEFLSINPRGLVPAITDGDFCLSESAAIVEYLDDRFPDAPRLFPEDVQTRARARQRIREVDTTLATESDVLAQELFFTSPEKRDAERIHRARDAIVAELTRLETDVAGPFALGEPVGAVDFALYPLLALHRRYELRQDTLGLVAAWGPKLRELARRVESLEYFDKTYPPHWRS